MEWLEKKVLIVEDSKVMNRLLVHSVTSLLKIGVKSVHTMEEACEVLKEQRDEFFVALLDLNLPDAPNGEIVDFVLKAGIPPIILTGNMSDNLHNEILEKPIVDYVFKKNLSEIDYIIQTIQRLRDNKARHVLVVDDSKSSRMLITSLLQRHNLNVLEAENAEKALALLNKYKGISLLITDYNMPAMNGVEFVTKVREQYPRTELAIIGISTTGQGNISAQFLKSGANDFIPRPFIHEEFYCRINQNLDAISSYSTLRKIANSDFLTGLFNRAYLNTVGEKLIQNAKRKNLTLCTAMIDIDHFKKINDNYGHHVGDEVLKHLASMFSEHLSEADIVARIGGEEFAILCVNMSEAYAFKLFERFLNIVSENPLHIDDLCVSITVSIGYTIELQSSLNDMLKNADEALYEAKNNGRNQVRIYSPALETANVCEN